MPNVRDALGFRRRKNEAADGKFLTRNAVKTVSASRFYAKKLVRRIARGGIAALGGNGKLIVSIDAVLYAQKEPATFGLFNEYICRLE